MTSNAEIVMVPIADIDPNPFRLVGDFPYNPRKIKALRSSVAVVGMWPGGILGRRIGNKVQIAFGHHRTEAGRQEGLEHLPITLQDLTDLQMLQFMGRENLEDYNADTPTMLETWRAAKKYSDQFEPKNQSIDIARILGWTDVRPDNAVILNTTARTCMAVDAVINGGYMTIADFRDVGLSAAREIAERTLTRIEQQEKLGHQTKQPRKDIEAGKQVISRAGKATAEDYRKGDVSKRDLRARVDQRAMNVMAADKEKVSPMFAVFAKALSNTISAMLRTDAASTRLYEISKSLHLVSHVEDRQAVERIQHDLGQLAERATDWRGRLSNNRSTGNVALLKGA